MTPSHAHCTLALNPVFDAYYCLIMLTHAYTCLYSTIGFTCIFVREILTPLNSHVQVLKRGLKWNPPLKIKPTSRSKLFCPSSFHS